jgi:hypothetical protein
LFVEIVRFLFSAFSNLHLKVLLRSKHPPRSIEGASSNHGGSLLEARWPPRGSFHQADPQRQPRKEGSVKPNLNVACFSYASQGLGEKTMTTLLSGPHFEIPSKSLWAHFKGPNQIIFYLSYVFRPAPEIAGCTRLGLRFCLRGWFVAQICNSFRTGSVPGVPGARRGPRKADRKTRGRICCLIFPRVCPTL